MAQQTTAGTLLSASAATGRVSVKLPSVPSVTTLFITISGTASLNVEIQDGAGDYIPVQTVTSSAAVRLAFPASKLAVNVTSNSGTVTVTYRSVVVQNVPNISLEVFQSGTLQPQNLAIREPTGSKVLYQGQVAATATAVYTVPASLAAAIFHMSVTNPTAAPHTITLWQGGSADGNVILPTTSILAGGWGDFDGVIYLSAGQALYAAADLATSITLTVHGQEATI